MGTDQKATLLLADGTLLRGRAIGKRATATGELCFNTGMTGYQEIYTDPSYYGQIIVNTTPHIGNYGVHPAEQQAGKVMFAGLVCADFSTHYSRREASGSLQAYLEAAAIPGITGIDTRALVRHIRAGGAQNAILSTEDLTDDALATRLAAVPTMDRLELSSQVSTKMPYTVGEGGAKRVAVLDLGVKRALLHNLAVQGLTCQVMPAQTRADDFARMDVDGYFVSNGPGDPAAMDYAVDAVKAALATGKPLFGICMGHQLLARAHGVPTYKMHHGHRGLNQPVINLATGRSEITSQNHGFAVDAAALAASADLELTHRNLNDDTVEGLRHKNGRAISVQYHPEASPGPHDSHYLFGQFAALLGVG